MSAGAQLETAGPSRFLDPPAVRTRSRRSAPLTSHLGLSTATTPTTATSASANSTPGHSRASSVSGAGTDDDSGGGTQRRRKGLVGLNKVREMGENLAKGVEIKFAPLNIPPHRRLQTAAVALWALTLPICLFIFLILLSFPPMWPILIPYVIWIRYDTAPEHGGRPKQWMRRLFVWKYFAQYYPCSIVKEADLPRRKTYLFGYHPHGIIGMGAFATFATEGTNFSDHFPGILPHLMTLKSNFKAPIYRDILLLLGVCSVSRVACANVLARGPPNAIAIVIGGAAESLSAHPGTADLTLKKRYGFVRIALQEGADLVPVFSFGENDIYDQMPNAKGTWIFNLQKAFQGMFGFTLPLFYGRGIFNYNYGLMPFRHPIVSVFGRPITIEKHPDPPREMVEHYQELYITELLRIWDKYKDVYARHRTKELTIVE